MLLNHKDAMEFIVDAVPSDGITVPVVRNLHSLLMQGLLEDPRALGAIRTTIVNIEGSASMGTPDPLRATYREQLSGAVQDVVRAGHTLGEAAAAAGIPPDTQEYFRALLETELVQLEPFNCARHRLTIGKTEEWIAKGRPT